MLAHLRNGHPYAQLAAGFGAGTTTAYRYITGAIDLLAALAPPLREAARTASARRLTYPSPCRSSPSLRPGGAPTGRLLWASPALPGAVHDIRAARTHGIIETLTSVNLPCWADKAYRGAGGTIRVPYRGRWENLSAGQQARNRSHAKIRALAEQAVATLKTWRLLRKLRCSTTRITDLVKAVLTLHLSSAA